MTRFIDASPTTAVLSRSESGRTGRRCGVVGATVHRSLCDQRALTTHLRAHTRRSVAYCSPTRLRTERASKAIQYPSSRQRRYPSQLPHLSRDHKSETVDDSDSGIAADWALKWVDGNPTLLRYKRQSEPAISCRFGFTVALLDADAV